MIKYEQCIIINGESLRAFSFRASLLGMDQYAYPCDIFGYRDPIFECLDFSTYDSPKNYDLLNSLRAKMDFEVKETKILLNIGDDSMLERVCFGARMISDGLGIIKAELYLKNERRII